MDFWNGILVGKGEIKGIRFVYYAFYSFSKEKMKEFDILFNKSDTTCFLLGLAHDERSGSILIDLIGENYTFNNDATSFFIIFSEIHSYVAFKY